MINIYILVDPRTDLPFYVGASQDTSKNIAARHASICHFGIRKELRPLKLKAKVEFIDTTNDTQEARILEEYWMWQLKSWGFKLDNVRYSSGYSYSPSTKTYINSFIQQSSKRTD